MRAKITAIAKNKRARRVGLVLALIAFAAYLALGDYGFYRQARLWMERKGRTEELKRQEIASDSLRVMRERLLRDTSFIEKIAREKLGMVRTDETVYKFIDTTGRAKNGD